MLIIYVAYSIYRNVGFPLWRHNIHQSVCFYDVNNDRPKENVAICVKFNVQ